MSRVEMNDAVTRGVRAAAASTPPSMIHRSMAVAGLDIAGASSRTGRKLRTGETVKYAAMTRK